MFTELFISLYKHIDIFVPNYFGKYCFIFKFSLQKGKINVDLQLIRWHSKFLDLEAYPLD